MESIKKKLIKKNFFSENDFIYENNEIQINYEKFMNLLNLENDNLIDYIKLKKIKNFLIKKNNIKIYENINFNILIELLEIFDLLVINKSNGLKYIELIEDFINILEKQYIFTYTFANFIQENYPNYSIKIEDDFLSNFKDLNQHYKFGPRTDIVIHEIKMIIEFDEKHHNNYENIQKDIHRDNLIMHLGYDVYHYKEDDDNIFDFCKYIKRLIQKKQVILDLTKFTDFIIITLLEDEVCNDEELLKLLTSEQCYDIIKGCSRDKIGSIPRNIKLKKNLFNWIGVVDSEKNKKEIKKIYDMLEDLEHKYEFNELENDYILSPNAFEQLLNMLDVEIYDKVAIIRETYRKIKNYFLDNMFQSFKEMIQNKQKTELNFISVFNNINYNQNKNDYNENKRLNKIIKEKNNEIEFLQQQIEFLLKDLEFKKKSYEKNTKLIINHPIVEYIPQLIFTGNNNERIKISDIKNHYEYNKKNCFKGVPRSLKQCLDEIKEKISYNNSEKSLTKNYLFGCKFEKKNKSNKIVNKPIQQDIPISKKSNQIEINDSDDEEM